MPLPLDTCDDNPDTRALILYVNLSHAWFETSIRHRRCAVEKVEGRIPEEFGVLLSGVGQAATSRKGGGLKAAFGRKVGQAAAKLHKEEAGMYRLSVPSREHIIHNARIEYVGKSQSCMVVAGEEQTKWVRQLMRCDIGGDIQEAQRIEEEKRVEQVALEETAAGA